MTTTDLVKESLEDRVIRHEGCELKPYKDTEGFWTLGIGHWITPAEAQLYAKGITTDLAVSWLHSDLATARAGVFRALPWLNDVSRLRQEVFVEMAFNLGLKGLLGFHRTLTYAEDGDWNRCAVNALLSKWSTQVKSRAIELATLLRVG